VWTDIHTRKIPNEYLLYAAILGITFQHTKFDKEELLKDILNFTIIIFILFPLYIFRVLGAGDIKFTAVWGMKIGITQAFRGFVIGLYVGSAIGLVAWAVSKKLKNKIPFSPAILIGMMAVSLWN